MAVGSGVAKNLIVDVSTGFFSAEPSRRVKFEDFTIKVQ